MLLQLPLYYDVLIQISPTRKLLDDFHHQLSGSFCIFIKQGLKKKVFLGNFVEFLKHIFTAGLAYPKAYLNFLGADESYPACNAILISSVCHYGNVRALQCKHSNKVVHVALYEHNQFCVSSINDKCEVSFTNTYTNNILLFSNSPMNHGYHFSRSKNIYDKNKKIFSVFFHSNLQVKFICLCVCLFNDFLFC